MTYSFDEIIPRNNTESSKWTKFPAEVLPFWVADMDFAAPDFILDAIRQRLDHPILGYTHTPPSLVESFQGWLEYHFGWAVPSEWVVWVPGVVPQLNLAAQLLPSPSELLIPTPVYHPFLDLAENAGIRDIRVPMQESPRWTMDFAAMADALTPDTRMLVICNPQNPTSRCYDDGELQDLANFVEQHDLLLVSDEIHANIVLAPEQRHQPVAAAHPELASRTITLYAATKIYNIPGMSCAAAVIPDEALREQFMHARAGLQPGIGPLEFIASDAAFNDRSQWIPDLLDYLRGNFALVKDALGDRVANLEATYLAWINVRDMGLEDTEAYFARHGIGISPGAQFGEPGHIRFNFGCPRQTLEQGLERLTRAIKAG